MNTNSALSASPTVSPEDIALRAREIWLARGCPAGQDLENWLSAERELSAPAVTPKKSGPKARASASKKKFQEPERIDVGDLQESLARFGEAPQRSPTALDLS